MSKNVCGAGKKVLASALSAAMVVAFAPAVAMAEGGVAEGSSTVEVGTGATGNDDDVLQPKNENTVAMIGSDEFETLQQAINAVKKGQTISVLKDVDLGSSKLSVYEKPADVVIDLGGNKLTGAGDYTLSTNSQNLTIQNGTIENTGNTKESYAVYESISGMSVTLKNITISSVKTGIYIKSNGGNTSVIVDEGTSVKAKNWGIYIAGAPSGWKKVYEGQTSLVVNGGSIEGKVAGIAVWGAAGSNVDDAVVVNVNGGAVTSEGYAIAGSGNSGYNATTINVNGGVLKSTGADGAGIYHPQKGTLNISGGSVEGAVGVQMCSGDLKVTGSPRITSFGKDNSGSKTGDGVIDDGSAISIVDRNYPGGKPTANIQSGVFKATGNGSKALSVYAWRDNAASAFDNANGSVVVSGGTFSDIANAVKYAANGATLKMGAKATSTLAIARGKDITLDLNGNDIEVSQGDAIVNKGKLKVVGDGVIKAAKNGCAAVANFPGANAVLNGGTYKSDKWYVVKNMGAMEIDGAVTVTTDNQTNPSSLIDNGWYGNTDSVAGENVQAQKDAAKLVIKSGDFKASSGPKSCSVVKNDDYGVLEIAGGTFDSTTNNNEENAATLLNWNVAKVTGGVFKGKYPIANGSYGAESADQGVVEVSGGTFVGSQTLFGCNGGAKSGEGKVSITAGTFSAPSLVGEGTKLPYDVAINGGTFSADASTYMDKDACYEYKMSDGTFIVQSKNAAAPGNSAGYNTWGAADANGVRSEEYVAPAAPVIPTPTPKPEPAPEPTPAAPGTAVSGTDNAGNKVDATVTDNTATILPDGTTAAGSVEYKGAESTGSTAPTTEVSVPSTVTASDGSTYVVTKIADEAFEGQKQLTKVAIPETVVEIGDKAFAGTSIEEVKIPAATTTIGEGVFQGCESLKTIDLSESAITEVPADAFNGTALNAVEIPATVTTIGARAFKDTALKSVSTDAATVARSAFAGCESLKSASLPKATEIGKYAFNGAAKLKSLATGKKLEVIGYKALAGTKVGTLTVSSKKLTKGSVKGSLKGSNVKKVVVDVSGSKKTVAKTVEKYKKFFTKKNCGKSVKVVAKKK